MTVKSQIESAIERSISHNEIVHVTIDGDSGAALAAISELRDEATDYTMSDYEGVDTLDIWGYDDDAPEGEMVWRLAIRFAASHDEIVEIWGYDDDAPEGEMLWRLAIRFAE